MSESIKRLNRELVHSGVILDIYKDTMELPNGKIEEWDFVSHRKGLRNSTMSGANNDKVNGNQFE